MAGISHVDYAEALAGRIKRRQFIHPLGAYVVERGGTYSSNEFVDANLSLGGDNFDNLLLIVHSAKKQGHTGVRILLTQDSSEAIAGRIAEISALEWADVETQRSKTYYGIEKLIVTFRERKAD